MKPRDSSGISTWIWRDPIVRAAWLLGVALSTLWPTVARGDASVATPEHPQQEARRHDDGLWSIEHPQAPSQPSPSHPTSQDNHGRDRQQGSTQVSDAPAHGKGASIQVHHVTGRISAISPERQELLLKEDQPGLLATAATMPFAIVASTTIERRDQPADLGDLQPGEYVRIRYTVEGGRRVAREIVVESSRGPA